MRRQILNPHAHFATATCCPMSSSPLILCPLILHPRELRQSLMEGPPAALAFQLLLVPLSSNTAFRYSSNQMQSRAICLHRSWPYTSMVSCAPSSLFIIRTLMQQFSHSRCHVGGATACVSCLSIPFIMPSSLRQFAQPVVPFRYTSFALRMQSSSSNSQC